MLNKCKYILLCASVLFCSINTLHAATHNYALVQGFTMEYELPPNEPQIFNNFLFWRVNATCTIHSELPIIQLVVKALKKTGSVNDTPLKAGDVLEIQISPNDQMRLSADGGASVELTNKSDKTMRAICST